MNRDVKKQLTHAMLFDLILYFELKAGKSAIIKWFILLNDELINLFHLQNYY